MPEIVNDGETGYLIDPGDSEQLSRYVTELLQNREKAISMGKAGHDAVYAKFSLTQMVNHLEAFMHRELVMAKGIQH